MSQISISKQEQKHCFNCNEPINFKKKYNKFGGWYWARINLDGTEHVCNEKKRQEYSSTSNGNNNDKKKYKNDSQYNRYWRWYWAYGPGARHRKNERRYSSDEYKERRKEAEERYRQYRERWTQKTEQKMSIDKALEVLELTKEVLSKKIGEKIQAVKVAYRKMCLRYHPDRNKAPDAQAKFIEATTAYEVLTS